MEKISKKELFNCFKKTKKIIKVFCKKDFQGVPAIEKIKIALKNTDKAIIETSTTFVKMNNSKIYLNSIEKSNLILNIENIFIIETLFKNSNYKIVYIMEV